MRGQHRPNIYPGSTLNFCLESLDLLLLIYLYLAEYQFFHKATAIHPDPAKCRIKSFARIFKSIDVPNNGCF